MDITFNCAKCQQHLVIDEAGAGLSVQCPRCGQALTVPAAKADIVIHAESAIAAAAKAIESGIFDDDQKLDAYLKESSPEVLAAVYGKKHAKAFLEGKINGKELLDSKHVLLPADFADLQKKFREIGLIK